MRKTAEDNPESGRTRRYTGELASPIRIPAPPTFSGAVTTKRHKEFREASARYQKETEAAVSRQKEGKIRLLLRHYGIADRNMEALALALAAAHVPGFQVIVGGGKKRGPKTYWDGPRLSALNRDVEAVKTPLRRTDRQALKFLVENDPDRWGPPKGHRHNERQWIETLESRLQDAKAYRRFIESFPLRFPRNAPRRKK
ncbi:MAG: hypothetical protein WAV38_32705 [Xanthobacteraceae bacterium]